jgi:hypothetical protein
MRGRTARDTTSDGGAAKTVYAGADSADGDGLGAPPGEWTWLDVAGSRCGNGSPTGIAVNVRPGAQRLVVLLEGGGACDSGQTCWVQPTADHIASGYGVRQLRFAFLSFQVDTELPSFYGVSQQDVVDWLG